MKTRVVGSSITSARLQGRQRRSQTSGCDGARPWLREAAAMPCGLNIWQAHAPPPHFLARWRRILFRFRNSSFSGSLPLALRPGTCTHANIPCDVKTWSAGSQGRMPCWMALWAGICCRWQHPGGSSSSRGGSSRRQQQQHLAAAAPGWQSWGGHRGAVDRLQAPLAVVALGKSEEADTLLGHD